MHLQGKYFHLFSACMTYIWFEKMLLKFSFLQAHNCSDANLSKKMFLPLAERMTKKYVDEGKIEAEAGN